MLVISRKVDEVICIGDNVFVTIVEIGQGKCRIGVVAPRDVPVDRSEVRDAKLAGSGVRPIKPIPAYKPGMVEKIGPDPKGAL